MTAVNTCTAVTLRLEATQLAPLSAFFDRSNYVAYGLQANIPCGPSAITISSLPQSRSKIEGLLRTHWQLTASTTRVRV
jgi:hypothetical protein